MVRDQEFLLPPNMVDWLPEGHLAWFVIDTVAEMDTSVIHQRAARCRDGQERRNAAGRAAYDPVMLLTLLIYAYACGERSSRRIERLCITDVAFKLICAGDVPDHTVLARFRKDHVEALTGLLTESLVLAAQLGMVSLGVVAFDGVRIGANASRYVNHTEKHLRALAERFVTRLEGVSDGLCTEVADETEVTDVIPGLGRENRNVVTAGCVRPCGCAGGGFVAGR